MGQDNPISSPVAEVRFVALLQRIFPNDVGSLSQVLGKILHEPALDVASRWRRQPGVLATGLSSVEGQALKAVLLEQNIPVLLVPEKSFLSVSAPVFTSGLDPDGQHLTFRFPQKQVIATWSELKVISLLCVKTPSSKIIKEKQGPSVQEKFIKTGILLTTGVPLPMSRSKEVEKIVTVSDTDFFVDILLAKEPTRIRLDPDQIFFDFLGKEKSMTALENLRTTVKQIISKAAQAKRNPAIETWLNNQPLASFVRESEPEFDEECRWLWALATNES
jgi:hypothetical protein